jgi:hypothetical protein
VGDWLCLSLLLFCCGSRPTPSVTRLLALCSFLSLCRVPLAGLSIPHNSLFFTTAPDSPTDITLRNPRSPTSSPPTTEPRINCSKTTRQKCPAQNPSIPSPPTTQPTRGQTLLLSSSGVLVSQAALHNSDSPSNSNRTHISSQCRPHPTTSSHSPIPMPPTEIPSLPPFAPRARAYLAPHQAPEASSPIHKTLY